MPDISATLPKTQREYRSKTLFPFFFGLLGVPGFYDNVKGGFYPSVNASKPFVAGDIVVADSDFVSWSPTRKLEMGFIITFR